MICYDIMDLGSQLKTMGLIVITDAMFNRVTENWKKGKRTHIFMDEFHVVFENKYSEIFWVNVYRRFRKRDGFPVAITQNSEYLLNSENGRYLLSNSETVVMFNQSTNDALRAQEQFHLSDDQLRSIKNVQPGHGLIKCGEYTLSFRNEWPTDGMTYKYMTTRPTDESMWMGNRDVRSILEEASARG
jgi:type IV secretory pathway VirB4 component